MTEVTITPEMKEILPKAVHEVTGLYLGDNLNNLLKGQSPEQRAGFWQRTAETFPPFSEKITALRTALRDAEITKNGYPEPVKNVMTMHFSVVEDEMARLLLTDVLFARTITSPGYMDYGMKVVKEAEAMVEELGIQGGLRAERMGGITLDKTIESILTGSLRLSRQTQLGERGER